MTTRQRTALHKAIRKEVERSEVFSEAMLSSYSEELDAIIDMAINATLAKYGQQAA